MKVLNDIHELPASLKGASVAIGNFDGLHLGHQEVIRASLEKAQALKSAAIVVSFEPPPSAFFHPEKKQFRLTPLEAKAGLIAQLGVDALLNLNFDEALAAMEADSFISSILHEQLGVSAIAVGHNFRFGKGRKGSADLLQENAAPLIKGEVIVIPPFTLDGQGVSSTAIRKNLAEGQVQAAAELLGRWFHIAGKVIEGKKLGRELGFPTLNIALENYTRFAYGIYAVRCLINDQWFDGVASIGVRPTIGDLEEPLLEVHLFDTDENFYHTQAEVFLLDFLREEQKFDDLDSLKKQMEQDSLQAKERLLHAKKLDYPFGNITLIKQ